MGLWAMVLFIHIRFYQSSRHESACAFYNNIDEGQVHLALYSQECLGRTCHPYKVWKKRMTDYHEVLSPSLGKRAIYQQEYYHSSCNESE